MKYVIITPARNEGLQIETTISTVIAQTMRPVEWIIVDDGSQDNTADIIDGYSREHSWIKAVHRPDRGFRNPGTGVIEAVREGLQVVKSTDWEYLVKLDADLTLDSDYFERCFHHFEREPELGIGGGTVYDSAKGRMRVDRNPSFHVRGATKIYRRACWDALGGLLAVPGWDTLDEVKANMLHWRTQTFADILVLQRRPTGSQDGAWSDYVKNGRGNYISGYHPIFMISKCLRRTMARPYLIVALALCYGYLTGYIKRTPRVDDPALIRYLRNQQLRRLLFLKSIWK